MGWLLGTLIQKVQPTPCLLPPAPLTIPKGETCSDWIRAELNLCPLHECTGSISKDNPFSPPSFSPSGRVCSLNLLFVGRYCLCVSGPPPHPLSLLGRPSRLKLQRCRGSGKLAEGLLVGVLPPGAQGPYCFQALCVCVWGGALCTGPGSILAHLPEAAAAGSSIQQEALGTWDVGFGIRQMPTLPQPAPRRSLQPTAA